MFSRDKQLMAAPMAADGALRRLFEKPLPENPTLLEALSACHHRNVHPNTKPIDPSSFTEIFGELHFQEKPPPPPPERAVPMSPPPPPRPPPRTASWLDIAAEAEMMSNLSKDDSSLDALLRPKPASTAATVKRSASFCMKKSSASSLLLCTEGLGSESTVDADDMLKDGADADAEAGKEADTERSSDMKEDGAAGDGGVEGGKEEKRAPPSFPPPIRSIGRGGGKPRVCFRSFREEGRFVLLEVVIPAKDLLQATREGGRLRLQFAANGAAAAAAAAAGGVSVGVDEVVHGEDDDAITRSQDRLVM